MREYTGAIINSPEDLYNTHLVARELNKELTFEDYKKTIDFQTAKTDYRQVIAKCDDKPVSLIAIQTKCNMSLAPKPECSFSNVATLPEHQGSGISCFVMQVAKKKVADEGYAGVVICCRKDNDRANAFYKKSGFDETLSKAWRLKIEQEKGSVRAKL